MKIPIDNAAAIGKVVRASRKAQKIRQDDAAGSIGVSENFLGKIERGSESVQWGKLFQVLEGLGIRVMVDVPESVAALPMFAELVVEGAAAEMPAETEASTGVEIVVGDVVIRVGADADEALLTRSIRAARASMS